MCCLNRYSMPKSGLIEKEWDLYSCNAIIWVDGPMNPELLDSPAPVHLAEAHNSPLHQNRIASPYLNSPAKTSPEADHACTPQDSLVPTLVADDPITRVSPQEIQEGK